MASDSEATDLKRMLKKIAFYLLLLTGSFILWIALEFLAQQLSDRFDPLRVDHKKKTLSINQSYFDDYFLYRLPAFYTTSASNRAIHLEKKNRFRIFCLGESTTAGYPYNTFPQYNCPVSYPNYLRAILQYNKNMPEIEMLNAGCDALNSLSVLQLFADLRKFQPDLVIIYSGHNEFFGPNEFALPKEKAMFYQNEKLAENFLRLRRTFLYQGIRWLLQFLPKRMRVEHQDYAAWSQKNYILSNDPLNEAVQKNYRQNLTQIARMARTAGIKLVFCTPVSNWTFPPFISRHGREFAKLELARWDSLFQQAKTAFQKGEYRDAITLYDKIKQMDSTYADLYFQSGKAYAKLNEKEAGLELWRAKDFDAMPFRAKSSISVICRETAVRENVVVADLEQLFIQLSNGFYPNPNLFVDHLHPNDEGTFHIAAELARVIVANGLIPGITGIQCPDFEECRKVLKITDADVNRVEYDLTNESYLASLAKLNPEIESFLSRIRDKAVRHLENAHAPLSGSDKGNKK